MTRISKDGGIDDMVKSTGKPINRVDKVSVRALQTDQPSAAAATDAAKPPKITYGNAPSSSMTSPRSQMMQPTRPGGHIPPSVVSN